MLKTETERGGCFDPVQVNQGIKGVFLGGQGDRQDRQAGRQAGRLSHVDKKGRERGLAWRGGGRETKSLTQQPSRESEVFFSPRVDPEGWWVLRYAFAAAHTETGESEM